MTTEEYEQTAQRMRPRLTALGRTFFGDAAQADDAAQEALVRLWLLRDRVNDVRHAEALLVRMTKNICVSEWRRSGAGSSRPGRVTVCQGALRRGTDAGTSHDVLYDGILAVRVGSSIGLWFVTIAGNPALARIEAMDKRKMKDNQKKLVFNLTFAFLSCIIDRQANQ